MARARNIKPGLFKNEDLAECSIWARYIFPGLWMHADRDGRLEDRPKRLKGELLPFDTVEIEPLLTELNDRRFIYRYRNEDGAFIQIVEFSKHQTPHYTEKPSAIKPPTPQELRAHKAGAPPVKHQETPPLEAPQKPRALQEHSEKSTGIKRGSLPPDSLIPDSLIPETLKAQRGNATTEAHGNSPGAALSSLCAQHRVKLDARGKAHVAQWAEEGLTEAQLEQAIAIARERKPDPAVIPIAYLLPIVAEVRAGLAKNPDEPRGADAIPLAMARIAAREAQAEPEWWQTAAGIQRQGTELGVEPRADEDFEEFCARVYAASGHGPWMEGQAHGFVERVEYHRAVGPS